MTIKNNAGETKSEAVALMTYFGRKPNQTLNEFMAEVKALSPESKNELVIGACREMGWTAE